MLKQKFSENKYVFTADYKTAFSIFLNLKKKTMKPTIVLCLLCFFLNSSFGQIGVSLSYRYLDAPYWGQLLGENETLLKNGHGFSMDYRFKLKNIGIHLLPEIGFTKFSNEIDAINDSPKEVFIGQFFNVQLNANIYPLDFFDQVKNNETITSSQNVARSFFVQFSPGVSMIYLSYRAELEEMLLPPRETSFFLNFGAGFDLHYKNYLTLTPMVRYQHFPNVNWEGLSGLRDEYSDIFLRDNSYVNQVAFALRLGIRWN